MNLPAKDPFRLAAALASGALLGLAFWPGTSGWLAWIALAPLFLCVRGQRPAAAFFYGWAFGAAVWAVGSFGMSAAFSHDLQAPWPVGWLVAAVLCAYNGLMYALLGLATALLAPALSRRVGLSLETAELAVASPAFAAIEGYFPMLFPNQLANTQFFHLPAVQSADVFGMAGLCWLIVGFNVALAGTFLSKKKNRGRWLPLAAAVALALLNEGYGRWRMRQVDGTVSARVKEGAVLRVALLQSGVATRIAEGGAAAREDFKRYAPLARAAAAQGGVALMLYPENSYGRLLSFARGDASLSRPEIEGRPAADALREDLVPGAADSLLGAVAVTRPAGRRYYAAVLADASGRILGAVAKRDRVPFWEYLPFDDVIPYPYRFVPSQVWLLYRGPHHLMITSGGARLGVYICYESVLESSAREYAREGAELLINPANSDQVLPSLSREQNLRLGALRAIENRRFILRPSTLTTVVDPVGRFVRSIPMGRPGFLVFDAPLMTGVTLYTRWGPALYRLGAGALALLTLAAGLFP